MLILLDILTILTVQPFEHVVLCQPRSDPAGVASKVDTKSVELLHSFAKRARHGAESHPGDPSDPSATALNF